MSMQCPSDIGQDRTAWTDFTPPCNLHISRRVAVDCVCLKWEMPDGFGPDQKFQVHCWSNDKDRQLHHADSMEQPLSQLKLATRYFAYVIVMNGDTKASLPSSTLEFYTGHFLLVLSQALDISNSTVKLNWSLTWDNADTSTLLQGQKKYRIYYWSEETDKKHVETHCSNYTIKGLKPDEMYSAHVAVVDGENILPRFSNTIDFRTAPLKLTGLRLLELSPTDQFATVVWDQPDYAPRNFKVKLTIDGAEPVSTETPEPVSLIKPLWHGSKYTVQVSIEENMFRAVSELLHFETAPGQVKNVKTTKNSLTSCLVSWDRVTGADSYVVKWRGCQNQEIATANTKEILTNLPENATFLCSVAAKNRAGLGVFSNSAKFCTDFRGPQNVHHEIIYKGDKPSVQIEFDSMVGQEIAQYHVTLSQGDCSTELSVDEPVVIFPNGEFGTKYISSVVAETVQGSKSMRSFGVPFWTRPAKVGSVRTYAESKTVQNVKWNLVNGAESYDVLYGCDASQTKVENCQGCEFLITDLRPCVTYFVEVSALNCAGSGNKSKRVFFNTAIASPSYLHIEDISTSNGLRFYTYWESCEGCKEYNIILINVRNNDDTKSRTTTRNTSHEFVDLEYGSEYYCKVQAISHLPSRSSGFVLSKTIWTRPPQVTDVNILFDTSTSRMVTWRNIYQATYTARVQRVGDAPALFETKQNEFYLNNLHHNSTYIVSVTAKIQDIAGKESERKQFQTALDRPKNIRFDDISNTSFTLRFDEPEIPAQHYQIRPISLHGASPEKIIMDRSKTLRPITITGLEPGGVYQVAIRSLHHIQELNSDEELSKIIRTCMPALEINLVEIEGNGVKINWKSLDAVRHYKVYSRIEHTKWISQVAHGHEASFSDLQPATKYEFKVTAVNHAGEGQDSNLLDHTTVPDPPNKPHAEFLSPVQVRIWCDKVAGAEKYVFKIDDKTFTTEQLEHTVDNGTGREILSISVQAVRADKHSSWSEILLFEQTMLSLKKRFQRIASSNAIYIPPGFKNVDSKKMESFENGDFDIHEGETCLILGDHSTGKTSACYYYMKNLPDAKLGVYLDCSKFPTEQLTVDQFLRKYIMMGVNSELQQSVLDCMKKRSHLVIFIIDNANFSCDFESTAVEDGKALEPQNILYQLISNRLVCFKDSKVFCTSTFEHTKSIINATKCFEIIGFGNSHIKDMISAYFEDFNLNEKLPENMKYFCVNPSYCKEILQLWKSGSSIDLESYSSLLVEILRQSMERYSVREKTEKLRILARKIERHGETIPIVETPSRISSAIQQNDSVAESETLSIATDLTSLIDIHRQRNSEEHTCKKLQRNIERALFYSYFCRDKMFKGRALIEEEKTVQIILSGLLKEKCIEQLAKLFELVDRQPTDAEKKRNKLKKHIKKHLKDYMKKLYSKHKITLHWLDVVAELNDKDLMKATKQDIVIKKETENHVASEVGEFLGKLPKMFFPYIHVTYAKDLRDDCFMFVDLGIGKNRYHKMIRVTDLRKKSPSSKLPSRTSTTIQQPSPSRAVEQNSNYSEDSSTLQGSLGD